MRSLFAVLSIALALHASPACARTSAASPLIGEWAVDRSRLPMPPEARPKQVTIVFADVDGHWRTQVDIVYADGETVHSVGTAALDGVATPVTGSPEADIAAVKMPQPDVLVIALGKRGALASTRIYAVAADGKTMVETATYQGPDGLPVMRTNHFTRVR